jgi:ABC-type bacteriocin/lantibiotic exporter with double-glycine peptidase domain
VPIIQQLGSDDCGPSCLAMVLAAHGVHGAAAECRTLCDAGRGGTPLRTLVAVADHFGLTARTRALTPGGCATLALPAIAHWQSRHFVVVERWTRRRVVIVDPAKGRQVLTPDEFAAGFSGTALELEPRPELRRSAPSRVPLWVWYLAAMFRDTASQTALVQIIVASLLLQAAGLAAPAFTKLIVDDVGPKNGELSLGLIAAAMAVLVVGKCLTTFLRSVLMIRLQARLDSRLTQGFFEHLLHLPYRFFQGRTSGDLLTRLSSNTMIREILTTQLLSFLLDGPFGLLYVVIIAAISPAFAVLVCGLAIVQAILAAVSLGPLRDIGQRTVMAKTDEQSCLVELMKGIGYIKASGVEERAYDRWATLFRRQLGVFVERSYLTAKVDVALGLARSGSPLVLLWFGAYLVAAELLPLGTMLALTALAASFLTPVTSLVQNAQQLQLLDAYVERLADVLEAEPEGAVAPQRARARATRLAGSIEARDLAYRFTADGPLVVSGVSFTVRPGEKLGIVGATGSGKSTILMLLLGLYRPTAGEVFYDGMPLSDLDPRDVRQCCGVVLQDSAVFGGSIRSNIEINAPGSSREQLNRASRIAGMADEIARFPLGYDTRVAEGGSNLSGGQRQRLAIARAVVTQPSILLLDEASSHLDVASEARLNANLERLRCTRIVIAHRLTAVRSATEILVLDNGHIVERGAHHDLVRRGAMYAALAAAQGNAGPNPAGSVDTLNRHDPECLTKTERRVLA